MRRRTFAISGLLLTKRLVAQQSDKKRVYQSVEVNALVKKLITDRVNDKNKSVADAARFVEDLGMDSLDVVELMVSLEERFAISFTDEELAPAKVRDAIDTVKKHLKEADRLR